MNNFTIIDYSYDDGVQPKAITILMKSHQLKMLKHCLALESGDTEYRTDEPETKDVTYADAEAADEKDEPGESTLRKKVSTNMGVIANPVGSGKSVIVMAIMATPLKPTIYLERNPAMCIFYQPSPPRHKDINVLVVPHSIFKQWENYLKTQSTLEVEMVSTQKDIDTLSFAVGNILISARMYNIFATMVNKKHYSFARVIFDEADSIDIPGCIQIICGFFWFISSSAHNLLHPKGGYLNATRDGVHPHMPINTSTLSLADPPFGPTSAIDLARTRYSGIKKFGFIRKTFLMLEGCSYKKHIFLKNCDELINDSFHLPNPTCHYYVCKPSKTLAILDNLIPVTVQQLICAGDIEGAIKASNFGKTSNTNLISIVCEQLHEDIQNKQIDLRSIQMKTYRDPTHKALAIEDCQKDLARLEQKIENLRIKIQESKIDPITFCDIEIPTIIRCCNQVFDFESITIYISNTNAPKCPMCRTDITKESLIMVDNDLAEAEVKETEFITSDHEKLANLKHILKNIIASDSRIIIFSEYDNSFKDIEALLNEQDIPFRFLKGHRSTIANNLKWHESASHTQKILLLNARFAGCGLNIHWANDVILYHKMDKDLEMQIIGRSNRPPRTTSTNVHRLLYQNTET